MDHDEIDGQVIDDYVTGRLPAAEAARFEDHYLTCEECLRRLELAEKLRRGLREVAAEELAAPVARAAVLAAIVRRRWAAAAGAVIVVALAATGALFWQAARLGRELDAAEERRVRAENRQGEEARRAEAAAREAGALRQRLAEERQGRDRLAQELSRERHPRRPQSGAAWVVALVPVRSGPAAGEPSQRLTLPPSPPWVVLSLDLDLPGPGPYRVRLERRGGSTVWTGEGLSPGPDETLAVGLDPALLPPGDYRLLVDQGGAAPVARFAFRVAR